MTLGCPKNLVDSEGACAEIVRAGHELVVDRSRADVIVVNTCAFIESAREESVQAILEAVEEKRRGRCRAVVVIGCLSQRYKQDLIEAEPGIDAVLGIEHAGLVAETIESVLKGERALDAESFRGGSSVEWIEHAGRVRSTPPWTAYVKISDGCDNRCAYCAIPDIRGRFRSRPEELIVEEAKRLAGEGVKELILVGQDLTQYGADLDAPMLLPDLLTRLAAIEGPRWIRLMYCYPTKITRDLIDVIAGSDRIVKYLDMPLQHGDERVLRAMNRRGTPDDYLRVIGELRAACPEIALRSSFIVGFPGETRAAFDNLLAFVETIQFDRVGAFVYSREEGTPAWEMKPRVGAKTAAARLDALMRLQQRISLDRNRRLVGRTLEILVESRTEDGAVGRSCRDAPEIDGVVHITSIPPGIDTWRDRRGIDAAPGEFVNVTITGAGEYDLYSDSADSWVRISES